MLACRGEPGGNGDGAELVAVEADGVGFVVEAGPTDVHGGRVVEQAFFLGVAVEAGDGAEATGDGGPGAAAGFKVSGEALDVNTAYGKESQTAIDTPGDELAKIQA